jgi:hypothetical protein
MIDYKESRVYSPVRSKELTNEINYKIDYKCEK